MDPITCFIHGQKIQRSSTTGLLGKHQTVFCFLFRPFDGLPLFYYLRLTSNFKRSARSLSFRQLFDKFLDLRNFFYFSIYIF